MFGDTPKDSSDSSKNVLKEDSVKWEYKDGTDGNIVGPFDTNKMIEVSLYSQPAFESESGCRSRADRTRSSTSLDVQD